jgi:hypothetical protein
MCLAKRKANSGPAGEAAGAEGSGPAGKAGGADIEWHDEGAVPPFGPIYPLSEKELQALQEYLRKELAAGKIRRSKSPAAAPIIEEEINRLPDHAECDHHIELVEGMVPPFGLIYSLSEKELQTLREYLRGELAAGKVRGSKSPAGAPINCVLEPDGSIQLCVDYRGLGSE